MTDDYIRSRDDIAACVLLYAILASAMADWGLTVIGLDMGGVELNPIMAPVFAAGPLYALAVKASSPAVCVLMYAVLRQDAHARKWALWTLLATTAISVFPVVWNLGQFAKLR